MRLRDAEQRAQPAAGRPLELPHPVMTPPPWELAETTVERDSLTVVPATAPALSSGDLARVPDPPARRRLRLPAAAAAVVVIAAAIGTLATTLVGPTPPLRLAGLVSANEVVVAPAVTGRLSELLVNEGDVVERGALIGLMDQRELLAELDHQRALLAQLTARLGQARLIEEATGDRTSGQLAQAEAQMKAARGDRDEAQIDLGQKVADAERARNLSASGLLPQQQLEQAETAAKAAAARVGSLDDRLQAAEAQVALARAAGRDVLVSGSDVAQAEAQIRQARATIVEAEARLKDTEIRAPLAGSVSLRIARQGEIVRSGDPILIIVDPDDVWVRVQVDETSVGGLAVGQTMPVELPSGERLEGRISQIAAEGEFATRRDVSSRVRDVRTLGFNVAVPNPDRRLHPGMTAYVILPPPATP